MNLRGADVARQWAILGAESTVATANDAVVDSEIGWTVHAERWGALRLLLHAHEAEQTEEWHNLVVRLGLSRLGYWLVMLCAAAELYPEAAAAFSIIAEDERMHLLTPVAFARLAQTGLEVGWRDALGESVGGGAAKAMGLVTLQEPVQGRPLTWQGLRLSESELSTLFNGADNVGAPRKLAVARVRPASRTAFDTRLVDGAAALLKQHGMLCLRSPSARAARQLAIDLATRRGEDALLVTVVEGELDMADLARLRDGLLVVDVSALDAHTHRVAPTVHRITSAHNAAVFVVGRSAVTGDLPAIDLGELDGSVAAHVWAEVLQDQEAAKGLATRFRVNLEEVRNASIAARYKREIQGDASPPPHDAVVTQVLAQGARRMGRMVTHLTGDADLTQLVVPPTLRGQLDDIVRWYAGSERVRSEMGVDGVRGLSCLFCGRPGTGKTFAARCLARELGLNLYRIDLSQVVSKYIGETEKALAAVFDEAEAGHGLLLFDEADALFGKRSEVKDAHDRYANIEVGYLLQRLEAFGGVVILTTNMRGNIDDAFVRRLRFVLEFPMPDAEMRRQLWEQALPRAKFRQDDLDLEPFIARFRLAGGNIANIGLAAAHLATATTSARVTVGHLVRATYRELEKVGRARSAADFGPLAPWLPSRVKARRERLE